MLFFPQILFNYVMKLEIYKKEGNKKEEEKLDNF